ncbi:AraC family transcriptional regulator [Cryobacterium zhongshanensis]|uniref:AraC family transcriptional regulator n=1 Tax=Cryobacterium zhongshanensis TaxID=2928153 RepID=A0AA41QWC7_9MICO|nr:AraC family transcriptional regulator [Cryobacterium zhongshanensis]MCI4657898.1 AraC family transcriptional regulator [Cryobacterium zhongshanensis]
MNSSPRRVVAEVAGTFREFRTAVSQSFVPLDTTCEHPDPFRGRIRSIGIDEVHVSEVAASGHVVTRTPELIARGDRNYIKLSLLLSGSGLLIQDNREAVLRPGDLAVYDTNRPYTLVFEDEFRALVMMFPKHAIDLPPDIVGQLTGVAISGTTGVGSLVAPFLGRLADNLDLLADPGGTRLAHSALDLVTTMVASELDATASRCNPRRDLVKRIHMYVDEHLASTDLGPGQIAAAHFISTRHLHGLFKDQGTTVSTWIRSRRLERCRRDLMNPRYADRPVAAIAARWGFVDAAHFSRVFKTGYGYAPSTCRPGASAL